MSVEEFNTHMGYINGKTDVDLLLEEDDTDEDTEKIQMLKVHPLCLLQTVTFYLISVLDYYINSVLLSWSEGSH